LEKICIIGDNGTGKTTILELIKFYLNQVSSIKSASVNQHLPIEKDGTVLCEFTGKYADYGLLGDKEDKVLFFPTGINLPNSLNGKDDYTPKQEDVSEQFMYDFNSEETLTIWEKLRSSMKPSIEKELSYRLQSLKGIKNQNDVNELKETVSKIEKYKGKNQNDYDKFAEFLNPLLSKFHVELNTKIDLDKFDEIKFLDLKTKDGTIIPMEKWSTGIRQLIYTILPLYTLKPKAGIIVIDEAENSLYPNTQRSIIDFYKSVCPDMQLIIATHSPILASSFEPWEVIELKFNEKGKVERKDYFKGENHVDNYHIHPMYLRWDSLFEEMFGVEGEGNDERTKMRTKLSILDREIKKANGKAEKKKLFEEYSKVAELLDWKTIEDA